VPVGRRGAYWVEVRAPKMSERGVKAGGRESPAEVTLGSKVAKRRVPPRGKAFWGIKLAQNEAQHAIEGEGLIKYYTQGHEIQRHQKPRLEGVTGDSHKGGGQQKKLLRR